MDLKLNNPEFREKLMEANKALLKKTEAMKEKLDNTIINSGSNDELVKIQMTPTGINVKVEFDRLKLKASSLKQLEVSTAEAVMNILKKTREMAEAQAKQLSQSFMENLRANMPKPESEKQRLITEDDI